MDFANVVGECCQEQRAVADAFGTGQGNGGGLECVGSGQADGFGHWLDFQIVDKTILYAGKGRLKNGSGVAGKEKPDSFESPALGCSIF